MNCVGSSVSTFIDPVRLFLFQEPENCPKCHSPKRISRRRKCNSIGSHVHFVPKDGCLIGGAHRSVRLIRCHLFIHLEIFEVHFNCSGSQKLVGRGGCSSRLRSCCGAVRILGLGDQFTWQAQGKPRLFMTGAGDRTVVASVHVDVQILWQVQ